MCRTNCKACRVEETVKRRAIVTLRFMEDTAGTKRDVSFSVTSSPMSQVYLVWLHAAALVPGQGTPPYDRTNGTISVNFQSLGLPPSCPPFSEYPPRAGRLYGRMYRWIAYMPCLSRASSPKEEADRKLTITIERWVPQQRCGRIPWN